MPTKSKNLLLLIAIILVIAACKQQRLNEEFSFNKIYYYGIQEDVSKIVNAIISIPDDSLSVDQREIKEKYVARFKTRTETFDYKTRDSLIINVLSIFQNYWTEVLMKKKSLKEAEDDNALQLANYLNTWFSKNGLVPELEVKPENIPSILSNLLKQNGYFSRIDRTGNILDLIIWTNQSDEIYTVNLADTTVNVPVIFIDSTVTLGWEGYATFDHFYPGGWNGADTLYCIKRDYDINSEKFKVSYLAHETQHFIDAKLYSNYSGWTAEYRAKLAELSFAEKTVYDLIDGFVRGAKNNSQLTHPYAEYRLIGDLSEEIFKENFVAESSRWKELAFTEINNASRKLLKQSSMGLKHLK